MKTQLPEKMSFKTYDARYEFTIVETINQMRDYLTELTEVVEGITSGQLGEFAGFECDETPAFKGKHEREEIGVHSRYECFGLVPKAQTHSLKETLLLELKRLPPLGEVTVVRLAEDGNAVSHLVSFKAVEDIINRLIP